jgi:hypothetical protein
MLRNLFARDTAVRFASAQKHHASGLTLRACFEVIDARESAAADSRNTFVTEFCA